MEMRLKIALLSIMAMISSGMHGDNRFHVFLYNYTSYQIEGKASFFCGISPKEAALNPAPNGGMARVDVTDCVHTRIQVTVHTSEGPIVLQSAQTENNHIWYEVREGIECWNADPHTPYKKNCASMLYLTYSNSKEPNKVVDSKSIVEWSE